MKFLINDETKGVIAELPKDFFEIIITYGKIHCTPGV